MSMATISSIQSSNLVIPFEVSVISPVHIGMDSEKNYTQGIDFLSNNGKIQIIDFNRIFKRLKDDKATLQRLTNSLESSNYRNIADIVRQSSNGNNFVLKEYSGRHIPRNAREIRRQFEQLNGGYLIPGSSFKGALRSVFIKKLIRGRDDYNDFQIFGSIDKNLMGHIQIPDILFSSSKLFVSKVFVGDENRRSNEVQGKWKEHNNGRDTRPKHIERLDLYNFTTIYESIAVGELGYLEVRLTNGQGKKSALVIRNNHTPPNFNFIQSLNKTTFINLIKTHTESYLKKEKDYFLRFSNFDFTQVISYIDDLIMQNNESENSCLMRVGAGSGFHSITGDWQKRSEDHFSTWIDTNGNEMYNDNTVKPDVHFNHRRGRADISNQIFNKTRKIFFDENRQPHLPGFIKLTLCERKSPGERAFVLDRTINLSQIEASTPPTDRTKAITQIAAPPVPEKPAVPEKVSGPFRKNMEIPAKVIRSIPVTKQVEVELLVEGEPQKASFRYPSGMDAGVYIWMRIQEVDKKKKRILSAAFIRYY